MKERLYILDNLVARKIYNLCVQGNLTKREISTKLYGNWLPSAVLPKIEELRRAGYLQFIEDGKGMIKKRGVYRATMMPVMELMKTRADVTSYELIFLDSECIRKEFFRINDKLRIEDSWLEYLRIFLDDMLLFRAVTASKVDKMFIKSLQKVSKGVESHLKAQKGTERYNKVHKGTERFTKLPKNTQKYLKIPLDDARNIPKDTESNIKVPNNTNQNIAKPIETGENLSIPEEIERNLNKPKESYRNLSITAEIYDLMVSNMLQKYGEFYNKKKHPKPPFSMLRTDYTCLSLLMPASLQMRVYWTSKRRQMYDVIDSLVSKRSVQTI